MPGPFTIDTSRCIVATMDSPIRFPKNYRRIPEVVEGRRWLNPFGSTFSSFTSRWWLFYVEVTTRRVEHRQGVVTHKFRAGKWRHEGIGNCSFRLLVVVEGCAAVSISRMSKGANDSCGFCNRNFENQAVVDIPES